MKFKSFLLLSFFSINSFAETVILDFESITFPPNVISKSFGSFTEDGYLLGVNCIEGPNRTCTDNIYLFADSPLSDRYKGSAALYQNSINSIVLTNTDNELFSLVSMDLAQTSLGFDFTNFTFKGTKSDLTTVTQAFSGTDSLQTFYFNGFNNLISVEWGNSFEFPNQSRITFDNITLATGQDAISAVPVPAALPLMASALGIFGLARRRNKSKAA